MMSSLRVKVSEAYFSSDWIYRKEHLELGVTNDGFLLNNILIKRKECTFRCLEMRSKRSGACDKIWICSVIFSKVQGLQYYFPENFKCKLKFYESEHFSDSSLHHPDLENSGAPNDNFRKNICSEDDLRARIFETFVVKFLAWLLLLGFSNI